MRHSNYTRLNKPNSLYEDLQSVVTLNENLTGNRVDSIMQKWSPNLRAIKEAFGGKVDDYKLMSTAILLENTSNFLNSRSRVPNILTEDATQPADVSFFKRYAINLLSAVVPNLIAEDIVSVQPMLSRIGEIRYLRVLYGSDKAPVRKDQTMFSNYNLGDNFSQSDYTSNHIEGEETLTTTVNGQTVISLSWTPVIPGSITILVNENEYSDDGNGTINYPGNAITVDYEKGTLTFANAVNGLEVGVTYDYNNMDVPVHAPDIKIRIVTCPIQAKSRKLRTLYSFDSAYDMCNDFGMTIN